MVTYKTPGVYVEEINTFPPGVAAVETAIPAFIGYVEKAEKDGVGLFDDSDSNNIIITPTKIKSLLDYETYFGTELTPMVDVYLKTNNDISHTQITPDFYLHQCVRHFYDNGGGECFIVPIGIQSSATVSVDNFADGLEAIKKIEDPTLLVAPDAVMLSDAAELGSVQQQMLLQSKNKQDRFAILDVLHDASKAKFDDAEIETFRNNVGANNLDYGAAYFPYLKTVYSPVVKYPNIQLKEADDPNNNINFDTAITNTDVIKELRDVALDIGTVNDYVADLNGSGNVYEQIAKTGDKTELESRVDFIKNMIKNFTNLNTTIVDNDATASTAINPNSKSTKDIHDKLIEAVAANPLVEVMRTLRATVGGHPTAPTDPDPFDFDDKDTLAPAIPEKDFNFGNYVYPLTLSTPAKIDYLVVYGTGGSDPADYTTAVNNARRTLNDTYNQVLNMVLDFKAQLELRCNSLDLMMTNISPLYARIKQAASKTRYILPPSAAMAGLYAMTDNNRGVWKAPANVGVNSIIGPTVVIDNNDQEDMNIDTIAGKSVNAIRAFRGKGTIVWGGRTLLGNDDNWRYVNVRRLFIFLETSIERAMNAFVFEPNTANTWVLVQTTIENFLTTIWRQGGLAGATAEDAFRVSVGLGKTMSRNDVENGFLIVDVSVAPSRPAEFIVLRFSQKLQVS